ncbi:hypothetical protein SDC9_199742 [bioreactor metagenome]|uniref:Uncharacterized protein n=1 Tax=bioreactor metagenome TaxID=1076179 RepID=A0A645ILB6_9ZZZZ
MADDGEPVDPFKTLETVLGADLFGYLGSQQLAHFGQFADIEAGHVGDGVLFDVQLDLLRVGHDQCSQIFLILSDHDGLLDVFRFA